MSKVVSVELKAHLAEVVATIATCWRITRLDGQEFFFTSADRALVFEGDTYEANSGMLPSSVTAGRALSPSNLTAMAFLESGRIEKAEIQAGLFDGASLDVFIVNYEDLSMGKLSIADGWILGQVTTLDRHFETEVRSRVQRLQQSVCELYSKRCRAILGDDRCHVDLAESGRNWTQIGTVVSVTDRQIFVTSPLFNETILRYGKVTWSDPDSAEPALNAGLSKEVKDYAIDTNTLTLFEHMPYTITPGDRFTIVVGCDRLFSTCRDVFENWLNFRGEPFIPGEGTIPLKQLPSGRHGWGR